MLMKSFDDYCLLTVHTKYLASHSANFVPQTRPGFALIDMHISPDWRI